MSDYTIRLLSEPPRFALTISAQTDGSLLLETGAPILLENDQPLLKE